jgi:hypothetical protein
LIFSDHQTIIPFECLSGKTLLAQYDGFFAKAKLDIEAIIYFDATSTNQAPLDNHTYYYRFTLSTKKHNKESEGLELEVAWTLLSCFCI